MSGDEVELEPGVGAKVGAKSAVGAVDGGEAPVPAAAVEAVDPSSSAEIAEALASGRIDAADAQALLIDQIAREQLGDGASAEELEALRGELTALLSGDPTLSALLRA